MEPNLKVEEVNRNGCVFRVMKITGFTAEQMEKIKKLQYQDMVKYLAELLGNTAVCWQNGYGWYTTWVSGDAVYAEIGTSCD